MNRECCYGLDAKGNTKPVTITLGVCDMWRDMRPLRMRLQGKRPNKGFY
jgi:hypothetical protein